MHSPIRRLVGALAVLLAACAPAGPHPRSSTAGSPAPARPAAAAPAPAARSTDLPSTLAAALPTAPAPTPAAEFTPDQLAGQRIVYSYTGATVPDRLLTAVRTGRAAGVIFFESNTADPVAFRQAVTALRQAAQQSPVRLPLLLMADQEGGRVRRLDGPPELSARAVGAAADP
ncbi:glycoside hydrolase family 3 N-terminal domain-containing protein, partial [Kitasatospora sp. LaBMicrA B282]|uniref:glycoside hydrolase family 3 N-terminal domain-containing protein n=1 Tax=Kitasatospora sp. LaBMicrA B282 TaxID=3420949 RepID=UPI003D0B432E